jgi:transposase
MSYKIEQKINGRIYVYEVESYWDKEKKQARQRRRYICPKERVYETSKSKAEEVKIEVEQKIEPENRLHGKPSNFISKTYGDVFLINHLQKTLGITDILKDEFDDNYKEMLALSAFMIAEPSSSYLFPYWHEEHYLENIKKLHSQDLSELYEYIGRHEGERVEFQKKWGQHLNPTSGIYYDITSISSYSENIEDVEWGYNRDKEYLPQINLGFTHCSKSSLPLSYNVHPGSIVDVTTLKNVIKTFHLFALKDLFFILDRGFCSISNILEMRNNKMKFIQPLSFSLKKAKDLVSKHKTNIGRTENAFCYEEELLYHLSDQIELEGIAFDAHIFYNEKAAIDYKHYIYRTLLGIENEIQKLNNFENVKECQKYLENSINCAYKKFFEIKDKTIIRNTEAVEEAIFRSGTFIFIVHGKKLAPQEIIGVYRNRDRVEKDINSLKNQIDTKRTRAHNRDTMNGRLFIKFLSLIVTTELRNVIKKDEKLKKYSLNEIIAELKKLKINCFDKQNKFMTELSKKQKLIFKAFKIDINTIFVNSEHGY